MTEKLKQKFRKIRIGSPSRRDPPSGPTSSSHTTSVPRASAPSSQSPDLLQKAPASTKGASAPVASSTIWGRAVQDVEKTEIWSQYCQIVGRESLSRDSAISAQNASQISPQQVSEISLLVTKLQDHKKNTQNQPLRTFIDKSVSFLMATKDAGSAVAALNPYASLGWSVLQFLLSAATTSQAIQKDCFETLPQVLDWTSRYQMFEKIYTMDGNITLTKADMEKSLQSLYAALLNYQVVCVVAIHSKMSRVASVFETKAMSATQQALDDLKQEESHWLRLQPIINREIDDAHYQHLRSLVEELRVESDLLRSQTQEMYRNVSTEQRLKVLDWISPVKYEDAHRQKKRQAMQHTADWLLEHPDYLDWAESGTGGALWLSGYMGSGKSCLVHAVIDDLESLITDSSPPDFKLAYYYCDGSDADKKAQMASADRILRALVKQLAAAVPDTTLSTELFSLYEKHSHKAGGLDRQQCHDLIVSMTESVLGTIIIVDGLDECMSEVQEDLIDSLTHVSMLLKTRLKLFIAGRPHLKGILAGLAKWTISVPEHNQKALELMIRTSVEQAAASPRLKTVYHGGPNDFNQQVVDVLISNAGGMYRWVDMALTFLHHPPVDYWEMKSRLLSLPRLNDLYELYDHMWAINMKNLGEESKNVIEVVILFLIYGLNHKLRMTETKDLNVRYDVTDHNHILEACTYLRSGELGKKYTASDLVALCPGFLDVSEDLVSLPHVSVADWLTSRRPKTFGRTPGYTKLVELCLQVFTAVESIPYNPASANGLALYASIAWPAHVRSLRDLGQLGGIATRLDAFLAGSPPPAAFLKWHAWVSKADPVTHIHIGIDSGYDYTDSIQALYESHPDSNVFACLYVDHCWDAISCSEHAIARRLMNRGCYTECDDQPEVASMAFAALVGNAAAVHWLKSNGLSTNSRNRLGWTAGHQYFYLKSLFPQYAFPDSDGLKILVEAGLDLHVKDIYGQTCFTFAIAEDNLDRRSLQVFIDNSYDIHEPLTVYCRRVQRITFLHSNQLEDVWKAEGSADDPERSRDVRRMDALHFAIICHRDVALELIPEYFKKYRDLRSRGRWLALAAKYSHEFVLESLIEHGADPLRRDDEGLLPLEHALQWEKSFWPRGLRIDVLAPLTLGPEVQLKLPVVDTPLRMIINDGCSPETIRLFVEYVASPRVAPGLWGSNLISLALEDYRYDSASYLWSLGCRDEKPSEAYLEWSETVEGTTEGINDILDGSVPLRPHSDRLEE